MTAKSIASGGTSLGDYLRGLGTRMSAGWDQFWFLPSDPSTVCLLRVVCGAAAVIYVLSHSPDLVTWFGPRGLLPVETVHQLSTTSLENVAGYRWSYFYYVSDPSLLQLAHFAGLLVAVAFTCGVFTRLTAVMTLVVILSYIHRAPMLTGLWEPVLSMSLLYLCFAPCGRKWSWDHWRRSRTAPATEVDRSKSVAATVVTRLMQVHLAALCFTMALTKLAGETWWLGEAMWWLIARTESGLVDLTGLRSAFLVINGWTHAVVLFELGFALLIWVRSARPILLLVAVLMWGSLGLVTGQLGFYGMMLATSLCFLDADHLRALGLGVAQRQVADIRPLTQHR